MSGTASNEGIASRSDRLALGVFAAWTAAAFPLILVLGRHMWFLLDEWYLLADRDLNGVEELLRPHNVHWTTLPIVSYRMLFEVFGLRTYLPYQMIVVALHLAAAVLLRIVLRARCNVRPWLATVAAGVFVLFGSGYENLIWAFQITFVGALVLGLVHLLLATHDGPIGWIDALGVAAGFAGLMCSGVAVTMTIIVGIAVVLRRGVRAAALHTLPLGTLYVAWWFAYARDTADRDYGDPSLWVRFVFNGVAEAFGDLGQLPGFGLVLFLVVVAGVAAGAIDAGKGRAHALAIPVAMLAGLLAFFVISAVGRVSLLGPEFGRSSRYSHIAVALILIPLAVAVEALARRWRYALPLLIAVMLAGVPGNIATLADPPGSLFQRGSQRQYRHFILSLGVAPALDEVQRNHEPDPHRAFRVTVGWLRDAKQAGRLADPGEVTPIDAATAELHLSLQQLDTFDPACETEVTGTRTLTLARKETFDIRGPVRIALVDGEVRSEAQQFKAVHGQTIRALRGPLRLRISPASPGAGVALCLPAGDGSADQ